MGSSERGTVRGIGSVCLFNKGGVVCCVGIDGLGSGRGVVEVL